eukprot:tig00000383_g24701.t1
MNSSARQPQKADYLGQRMQEFEAKRIHQALADAYVTSLPLMVAWDVFQRGRSPSPVRQMHGPPSSAPRRPATAGEVQIWRRGASPADMDSPFSPSPLHPYPHPPPRTVSAGSPRRAGRPPNSARSSRGAPESSPRALSSRGGEGPGRPASREVSPPGARPPPPAAPPAPRAPARRPPRGAEVGPPGAQSPRPGSAAVRRALLQSSGGPREAGSVPRSPSERHGGGGAVGSVAAAAAAARPVQSARFAGREVRYVVVKEKRAGLSSGAAPVLLLAGDVGRVLGVDLRAAEGSLPGLSTHLVQHPDTGALEEAAVVGEAGVFAACMRSQKKAARDFHRWAAALAAGHRDPEAALEREAAHAVPYSSAADAKEGDKIIQWLLARDQERSAERGGAAAHAQSSLGANNVFKLMKQADVMLARLAEEVANEGDPAWKLVTFKDGVRVYCRRPSGPAAAPNTPDIVRGVGHIKAPPSTLFRLLWETEGRKAWDPLVDLASTVAQLDERHRITYLAEHLMYPGYKCRDFCLLSSWRKDAHTGELLVGSFSVTHDRVSPLKEYIRGELLTSGFCIRPGPGFESCEVVYVAQVDYKGILSRGVEDFFRQVRPLCIASLRRLAVAEAASSNEHYDPGVWPGYWEQKKEPRNEGEQRKRVAMQSREQVYRYFWMVTRMIGIVLFWRRIARRRHEEELLRRLRGHEPKAKPPPRAPPPRPSLFAPSFRRPSLLLPGGPLTDRSHSGGPRSPGFGALPGPAPPAPLSAR